MKNKISNHQARNKTSLKWMGQILIIVIAFYFLSWLIDLTSFPGRKDLEPRATAGVSSQEIYDNFDFKVFDVKWNESNWAEVGTGTTIQQLDGVLNVSREVAGFGGLNAHRRKWSLDQINYMKSIMLLKSNVQTQAGDIGLEINAPLNGNLWFAKCAIQGGQGRKEAFVLCNTADGFSTPPVEVSYDTWHVVRFEVDAEKITVSFFVDGQNAGIYIPQDPDSLRSADYSLRFGAWSSSDGVVSGSFDYVQLESR